MTGTKTGKERTNAAQGHASGFACQVVTPNARVFELLWPGANAHQISRALGSRISPAHVRMYRTGARHLPGWLRELARARAAAILDAETAAPKGNGREAGWNNINIWRAARNSER